MPALGWYSGDTHAHRTPAEMPLQQAAEDVNVAFPLTFWVTKAFLPPTALSEYREALQGYEAIARTAR